MGTQYFWRLLVLFAAQLAIAELPANTIELDLVFPRAGGTYAATDNGLPVLLSLHNPDVAYHYGWVFSWDVYKKPHGKIPSLPFNTIGAIIKNDTTYADNPHIEVAYTDHLDVGEYTFSWTVHTGPWCEFLSVPETTEYAANTKVGNGSFDFTIEQGAPTPTFTGTCPTALGMISYETLTTYHGLYDGKYDDATSSAQSCGVTMNITATPEPCRATVNAAQETSISSQLHWGTFATESATASATTSVASVQHCSVHLLSFNMIGPLVLLMFL
ncbi:hypothetical protein EsH8_I_000102 [Colletotrichum jinshuiense]